MFPSQFSLKLCFLWIFFFLNISPLLIFSSFLTICMLKLQTFSSFFIEMIFIFSQIRFLGRWEPFWHSNICIGKIYFSIYPNSINVHLNNDNSDLVDYTTSQVLKSVFSHIRCKESPSQKGYM